MKKKLLVTGASGLLAKNILDLAAPLWEVYGTYLTHPLKKGTAQLSRVDLTNQDEVTHYLEEIRPHAIIHTAAASIPHFCQTHPEESHRINVEASLFLAQWCAAQKIPFVFTSTDLVFDGFHPPYTEQSATCPINIYGEQKALAEKEILQIYPESAICRIPLLFGWDEHSSKSLHHMVHSMKKRDKLHLFVDEFRSMVDVQSAAYGLLLTLQDVHGILHLGGKEPLSRYDFGKKVSEIFNIPTANLIPLRQKDMPMETPRSLNVTLDSQKSYDIGYDPSLVEEVLHEIAHQHLNS